MQLPLSFSKLNFLVKLTTKQIFFQFQNNLKKYTLPEQKNDILLDLIFPVYLLQITCKTSPNFSCKSTNHFNSFIFGPNFQILAKLQTLFICHYAPVQSILYIVKNQKPSTKPNQIYKTKTCALGDYSKVKTTVGPKISSRHPLFSYLLGCLQIYILVHYNINLHKISHTSTKIVTVSIISLLYMFPKFTYLTFIIDFISFSNYRHYKHDFFSFYKFTFTSFCIVLVSFQPKYLINNRRGDI